MTTQMTHPASLALEAYACGEKDGASATLVQEHLAGCDACREHVAQLGGLVSAGPDAAAVDALVARALASVAADAVDAEEAEHRPPLRAVAERRDASATTARRSRLWLVTSSVAVPLAAAAAILFLVRTPSPVGDVPPSPSPSTHRIQIAPQPNRSPAPGVLPSEPDTTFKGAMQLAVVRDRQGDQARFASAPTIQVRTGDRLRIEVALDREQAILGGVLADDGSYLELMPLAVRGPGTHFSEKSAKIDPSPTHGTIVVGSPDAIALVRASKSIAGIPGLLTLRVDSEGTP